MKTGDSMEHKVEREWQSQHEDLLLAIDQLEQMRELMGEVLCRVKKQVNALEESIHTAQPENGNKKKEVHINSKSKKINLFH
jgi:division protein CdvB (Snf7/Vps24/ESCRT-III family)